MSSSKWQFRSARSFASRLFGYDIFISFALGPPPRGTQSYASDLARRLRERDFTVFFSEDEAPPGAELDDSLRKALRHSKALVVIANRGTLEAPRWIRKEVEEFRTHYPTRAVIPISVGGSLQDPLFGDGAQEWLKFRDRIWLDESNEAVANGIAADGLVERLATAPTRYKSNVSWRWVIRGVLTLLLGLAIALGVATNRAIDSAERARAELRQALSLRLVAEGQLRLSRQRAGGDERALLELLAAHRIAPSPSADSGLLTVLQKRPGLVKLALQSASATTVAFSPDGSRIVSGGGDGTLHFWDVRTLTQVGASVVKHAGGITRLTYCGDGKHIVSGSTDRTVRVWDAATGAAVSQLIGGHRGWAAIVGCNWDGSRIVSIDGVDGKPRLWDGLASRLLDLPLSQQAQAITSIEFSPQGRLIVMGSSDGSLQWWDLNTGESVGTPHKGHAGAVMALAYSHDGAQVVSAGVDGTLRLWDAATGDPLGEPSKGQGKQIAAIALSPDGKRVVVSGIDNLLRIQEVGTWKLMSAPLEGHQTLAWAVAYSPDGTRIVSVGGEDNSLRLWDAASQAISAPLAAQSLAVNALAFSPDGRQIVGGGADKQLHRWDVRTWQVVGQPLAGHEGTILSVAFSRDGKRIVSSSDDKTLRQWDARSGLPINEPIPTSDAANAVAYCAGDKKIVASQRDGIRLWDAAKGEKSGGSDAGNVMWVAKALCSPDGKQVVTAANNDPNLRQWSAETGLAVGEPLKVGHRSGLSSVAFSREGNVIITGALDGLVRMWDVAKGKTIGEALGDPLAGLTGSVTSLAYGGAGHRIVSSHGDGLRFWDAETGSAIGLLPASSNPGAKGEVAYSPDESQIATASDGSIRMWPAPAAWPAEVCAKLTRNMSHREWRAWVSVEIPYLCQCPGLPVPSDGAGEPGNAGTCPGEPSRSMVR